MTSAWTRLLRQQKGLITAAQAAALGVPPATLHRRTRGARPTWQKVLPRVYATFPQRLTDQQHVMAATLYGGDGAIVTGAGALHWRAQPYLPSEGKLKPVDIVVPIGRDCASTDFARVTRSHRELVSTNVNHVRCASTARATADCARHQASYETVLALVSSVINSDRGLLGRPDHRARSRSQPR